LRANRVVRPKISCGRNDISWYNLGIFSSNAPPRDWFMWLRPVSFLCLAVAMAESASAQEKAAHWAFQPVKKVAPPLTDGGSHPIDAFLHAKLVTAGITPNVEADRRTLVRRLSFDLTGLPPTHK